MPPRAGQLATGSSSSAADNAAISPPWATSTIAPLRLARAAPFGLAGDQLGNQRQTAAGHVDPAFAAVRRPGGVVAPGQPGTRGVGIDLGMRQALPVPQMGLAQPGSTSDLQAGALPQPIAVS